MHNCTLYLHAYYNVSNEICTLNFSLRSSSSLALSLLSSYEDYRYYGQCASKHSCMLYMYIHTVSLSVSI